MYSENDWRNYALAHASKYDWSSGTNPSDYNHDYWEANKERIMAQRKSKQGAVRDFGGSGIGYKAKKDGTTGRYDSDYENDGDWTDELTDDEIKNIKGHNSTVDANIAELKKSVEDYINANKGSLTQDQIDKLRADMNAQISIANEQRINTKNSDDYDYVMGLRKKETDEDRLKKWGDDFASQFREQYKAQGGKDENLAKQIEQQFRDQLNAQYEEQKRRARK